MVHKGIRILADIAHRGQIDIQPQAVQKIGFFRLHAQGQRQAALFIGFPGLREFFAAEGRIPADPTDRSALLVHRQKHGDWGCVLVGTELTFQAILGFLLKIHSKEHVAPQVVIFNILYGRLRTAPSQEQLADLFLQTEPFQDFRHRVRRFRGRRFRGVLGWLGHRE